MFSRLTQMAGLKRLAWLTLAVATCAGAQSLPASVDAAAVERFERAVSLARQQPETAIDIFESLTRDHPDWPEPYNNLAVLYAEKGDEKKAEQALLSAMATHPSYALVHKNLEALYAGMAGRAYRKALKGDARGPAPPKLRLASNVDAATLATTRPATTVAAAEPAPTPEPEPQPEPAAQMAGVNTASPQPSASSSESADDARRAVLSTVASWLEAWSSQDVDRYLSFYGHHFDPGPGKTRELWAASRRKRVAAPEFIQIDIRNPSVSFQATDRASVRFVQSYRSNTFEGQTIKTLRLSRGSDGWKIVSEETGG